jgi:parallel beta-helix repeat protein/putative cofactor-binding repeat protein
MNRTWNILDYGATPGADAGAALGKAIRAASAGDAILVPDAFTLGSSVILDRPLRFVTDSTGSLTFTINAPFVLAADRITFEDISFASDVPTRSIFNEGQAANHEGLRFDHCALTGLMLSVSAVGRNQGAFGGVAPIGVGLSAGFELIDTEVTGYTGSSYAVAVEGVQDSLISHCRIHDNGQDVNVGEGIKVSYGSSGTRIEFNTIWNQTRDGIDLYNSRENTVVGNIIRDCGGMGIDQKWQSRGDLDVGRNIIQGNRIINPGQNGIHADNPDAVVSGNTIENPRLHGIQVSHSFDAAAVPTPNVRLMGNTIIGSAEDGINVVGARSATLIGNVSRGNARHGIYVGADHGVQSTDCIITGNVSRDNGTVDIAIARGGHYIAGNVGELATM